MSKNRTYVTTSIPYVNARPHVGHALEFVQADVIARHRRQLGHEVRYLSGTDDNALTNVRAAEAAGRSVADFVNEHAAIFEETLASLNISNDDFIKTSSDVRHARAVQRLWELCNDDLYQRDYEGLYCVGCERFYTADELVDGLCADHRVAPEHYVERNWFFRLSKYREQLLGLIESETIHIRPTTRLNEVLGFLRGEVEDLSVSRSQERAHGWGVPVPGDLSQVVYVWFDAVANYISAVGFGVDGPEFEKWWENSDEIVHMIGKGIVRFHAVYWVAFLLSADLRLPSHIVVHDYLTVDGVKISKSSGNAIDPADIVGEFGADIFRWWCLSDVPLSGDADFTRERLIKRWNDDVVSGVGNAVNRVVSLLHLCVRGEVDKGRSLFDRGVFDEALNGFEYRAACEALTVAVSAINRTLETTEPWKLRHSELKVDQQLLRDTLNDLFATCCDVAKALCCLIPESAAKVEKQLAVESGRVTEASPLFSRL